VVRNARVGGLIEGVKLHLPTSSSSELFRAVLCLHP
jgi:hypothetical protein